MKSILEVESIIKYIKERQIISDCYFTCETGDIIGLLGRNGAGKSLLLKIIFGVEPAYNKFVRIDHVIYDHPYRKKQLIAYLPQHRFLPKNMTVARLIKTFTGRAPEEMPLLQHTIVQKNLLQKVGDLSGGELRFLEILLIFALETKFVLLDEPFTGIEPLLVESMMEVIRHQSTTQGIVITDHKYELILQLGTKNMLLANGACRRITSPEDLKFWQFLPANR